MIDLTYFSQYDTKHIDKTGQFPTNTFSFIDNGADNLVVTVGCSWTWGANMTEDDNQTHRLKYNFGRVLANELSADWLLLGQVGTGNFWLYQKVEEFVKLIPTLKYKKIYIVCTLTEIGRQCYTELDSHIDYKEYFRTNTFGNDLLQFLNDHAVNKIIEAVKPYGNVILRIGTNFIDQIGVDSARDFLIPTPWLERLCQETDTHYTGPVYTVSHKAMDALRRLQPYSYNGFGYTLWLMSLLEKGGERIRLCQECDLLMPGTGHPGIKGHNIWAQEILKTL